MNTSRQANLKAAHAPHAIAQRLEEHKPRSYVGDAVLGAIDGCITTFAVVSSVVGAALSGGIVLALGLANLVADGFSMAVSNYQRAKSDQERITQARRTEEKEIEEVPAGEREEIRQIFACKGFAGPVLDDIVAVITQNRERWVETMLTEELGLQVVGPVPGKAALITFVGFVLAGLIPLVPFALAMLALPFTAQQLFLGSACAAGVAFFAIGGLQGRMLGRPLFTSGLKVLLTGGAAAALAYAIGAWLRDLAGTWSSLS